MFAASKTNGAVSAVVNYIEDVFSTWLYTGTGATQTITNGIDLSTKGGLVWLKSRLSVARDYNLYDTARGATKFLQSDTANAQTTNASSLTAFNNNGFTVGSYNDVNASGESFVSWTFRKQAKFFDVVTYTGTGANRTITHNLGAVPGCIMVKRTDTTADWAVYHSSLANTDYLVLDSTAASATGATIWNSTTATSSVFSVGTDATVNASGGTYVAYLFASNAGGFGLTGTDNVISCGSYTGNGSTTGPVITLGYEPQWLLVKNTTTAANWRLFDNMRGFTASGSDASLLPNTSSAETTYTAVAPTSTGFQLTGITSDPNRSGDNYIYIAIRRGPMKVPTDATTVYSASQVNSPGNNQVITTNFPVDMVWTADPAASYDGDKWVFDRLRGSTNTSPALTTILATNLTNAEQSAASLGAGSGYGIGFDYNTTIKDNFWSPDWGPNENIIWWNFKRAPNFFDEVCYTGNGPGTQTVNHNLTVAPELVINKTRGTANGWTVFQGSTTALTGFLRLNATNAQGGDTLNVTSTTITVDSTIGFGMNTNGSTYVTYLFATCPGVSKVGRYTGTGASQVVDCGFTGGARFVIIKRYDSTGDWYVYDTTRGMVSGTDPYIFLNGTAAQNNSTYVYTSSTGFTIQSTAPAGINASGGTYIFLAIA
jgi:hypothetical protein